MLFQSIGLLFIGLSSVSFAAASKNTAPANVNKAVKTADTPKYNVKVINLKPQTVIVMKVNGNIAQADLFIEGAFNRIDDYLAQKKIKPAGAPFTRIFRFQKGEFEFESGYPIKEKFEASGDFLVTELPGGKAATTVHVNATKNSQKAYKAIEEWLRTNNYTASGAPWEVYVSKQKVAPELAKIQVFYPLKLSNL